MAVVVALVGLTACSSAPVGETPESTVAGFYRALGAKAVSYTHLTLPTNREV